MKWLLVVLMLPPLVLSRAQSDLQEVCPPRGNGVPAALMGAPLPCLQPIWTHTLTRLQRSLQRLQDELRQHERFPMP